MCEGEPVDRQLLRLRSLVSSPIHQHIQENISSLWLDPNRDQSCEPDLCCMSYHSLCVGTFVCIRIIEYSISINTHSCGVLVFISARWFHLFIFSVGSCDRGVYGIMIGATVDEGGTPHAKENWWFDSCLDLAFWFP